MYAFLRHSSSFTKLIKNRILKRIMLRSFIYMLQQMSEIWLILLCEHWQPRPTLQMAKNTKMNVNSHWSIIVSIHLVYAPKLGTYALLLCQKNFLLMEAFLKRKTTSEDVFLLDKSLHKWKRELLQNLPSTSLWIWVASDLQHLSQGKLCNAVLFLFVDQDKSPSILGKAEGAQAWQLTIQLSSR